MEGRHARSRNCPRDIPGPLLDVCIRMQRRGFDSSARGYMRRASPSFRGGGGWPRPPASMAYMPRLRPGTRAFALALAHHGSLLSLTLPSRVRNHTSTLPKIPQCCWHDWASPIEACGSRARACDIGGPRRAMSADRDRRIHTRSHAASVISNRPPTY